jgi:hypothetical protein
VNAQTIFFVSAGLWALGAITIGGLSSPERSLPAKSGLDEALLVCGGILGTLAIFGGLIGAAFAIALWLWRWAF